MEWRKKIDRLWDPFEAREENRATETERVNRNWINQRLMKPNTAQNNTIHLNTRRAHIKPRKCPFLVGTGRENRPQHIKTGRKWSTRELHKFLVLPFRDSKSKTQSFINSNVVSKHMEKKSSTRNDAHFSCSGMSRRDSGDVFALPLDSFAEIFFLLHFSVIFLRLFCWLKLTVLS